MPRVILQASRQSGTVSDGKKIQGKDVYEFEFNIAPPVPIVVADCQHAEAASTTVIRGSKELLRPCPLKPAENAPDLMCSVPQNCEWRGSVAQAFRNEIGQYRCPRCQDLTATAPAQERFQSVPVTACPSCPQSGLPSFGSPKDRVRVMTGFGRQLRKEDFSNCPELTEEDRALSHWKVLWERTSCNSGVS